MTIIPSVSENRKKESELAELPPMVALVWDAVFQLPPDEQALLRVLLTNDYDFEHPKASGQLLAALAAHWRVTHRTARNRLNAAIEHPALQRAGLRALPEIDVSRSGLDDGKSVRTFTTQGTDPKGDNYRQSRHDRTRGDWWWKPGKPFTVGGKDTNAPGYLSTEGNRSGTLRAPGYVPPNGPALGTADSRGVHPLRRVGTIYGSEVMPRPKAETLPPVTSWTGRGAGEYAAWEGTHTAPGTRINQLPLGKVGRYSATQLDLRWLPKAAALLAVWRAIASSVPLPAEVFMQGQTKPVDVAKVWGKHGRHAKVNGGAGLATFVVGAERRVIPGKAIRWIREAVRPGGLPGRCAVGYTYVLAGKPYASALKSPAGSTRRDSRRRCGPYCHHPTIKELIF